MVLVAQSVETPQQAISIWDRLTDPSMEPLMRDHGLPLAIMGILVVFAALGLVIAFIVLLPRLASAIDRAAEKSPGSAGVAVSPHRPADATAERLPVLIAAAVAAVIDEPHRIIHTQRSSADVAWTSEGRRMHHESHKTHGRW